MHRQEGGREAEREIKGEGKIGALSWQGLFQPAHVTTLKSFAESNLSACQSSTRHCNFLLLNFRIIYFTDKYSSCIYKDINT